MIYKKINLLLASMLVLALFFNIPVYNEWIFQKVLNEPVADDFNSMDLLDRNLKRFGYSYTVFSDVSSVLHPFNDAIVLLPPQEYVKTKMADGFIVPEPAVFYYFTGLHSVWVNSPEAYRANWALIVKGPQNIVIKKMSAIRNRDSFYAVYRQYIN